MLFNAAFLYLFGVKDPQIDIHQAAIRYLIRCSLKGFHLIIFSYSITVYTADWQINSEECESEQNGHSFIISLS